MLSGFHRVSTRVSFCSERDSLCFLLGEWAPLSLQVFLFFFLSGFLGDACTEHRLCRTPFSFFPVVTGRLLGARLPELHRFALPKCFASTYTYHRAWSY